MKCDNFLLEGYVDHYLTVAERREVEQHLHKCASCQAELARLQEEQVQIVRDLHPPLKLTKSFADDIMSKIEQKPVRKKKRNWQVHFTMAATAMLAIGLVVLNKDALFTQPGSPVNDVQQERDIIFEDVVISPGQAEISLSIEGKDGKRYKPHGIANVSVYMKGPKDIDITDRVQILTSGNDEQAKYIFEFEDSSYENVKVAFDFKEDDVKGVIELDLSNVISETNIEPIVVEMQGRRLKDGVHEIFYRTSFNNEQLRKYQELQQQQLQMISPFEKVSYMTHISYELTDAAGNLLIGRRGDDTSFEGLGIGSTGSGGIEIGENFTTLNIPEQYGNFPMTMHITSIDYSIPLVETKTAIVNDQTHFKIGRNRYSVDVQKQDATTLFIEIKGNLPAEDEYSKVFVKVEDYFILGEFFMSYDDGKFYYTITVPDVKEIPTSVDLLFAKKEEQINLNDPVEIIID